MKIARHTTMPCPESAFVDLRSTSFIARDSTERSRRMRLPPDVAVGQPGAALEAGGQHRARESTPSQPNRTARLIDFALPVLVLLELVRSAPHGISVGAGVVIVATGLPLFWRRRTPVIAVGATTVASASGVVLGFTAPMLPFGPLVALFTSASLLEPRTSLKAAAASATLLIGSVAMAEGFVDEDPLIDWPVSLAAAWILGYSVKMSRSRAELLERQADQTAKDQAAATRLAIQQERARIARELHDIVAHHVSVMVVQATAANRFEYQDPDQARRTLFSLATIGRSALIEMRRLLDVLHTEDEPADHWPMPRLEQIPMLVRHVQQAGLPVRLDVRGEVRPLPAGIELNAYRIIQEALTNTLKHAGPTTAHVVITYRADQLELRISDRGCGLQRPNSGRGLVGMRERVGLVGGRLDVGAGPDGGFVVAALLPVHENS